MEKQTTLIEAARKIAAIYSSDDGVCLTPDPRVKEQQVVQAWYNLRIFLGLTDDLK